MRRLHAIAAASACLAIMPSVAYASSYTQIYAPFHGSLAFSALFAVLPLALLFILLGGLRVPAKWAAAAALAVSMLVALLVYGMPAGQVASSALEGAAIGFFPIIWIGINAIWVHDLTEASGHSDVLRRAFGRISDDPRAQAILVAFCFGALLEGFAGGGSPVAICAVVLIALGLDPLRAAAACLIADTSPVAFGSLGLPITMLSKVSGLPVPALSAMVGRQTPLLALLVPFILLVIVDGRRGLRQAWPLASVAGTTYAGMQAFGAATLPVELVDVVAALFSIAASVLFLQIWKPGYGLATVGVEPLPAGAAVTPLLLRRVPAGPADPPFEVARAFAPYGIILLVVASAQFGPVAALLDRATSVFAWPGLAVVAPNGKAVAATLARFEWLRSAGSLVLIAGFMSAPVLGVGFGQAFLLYGRTLHRLRWAILVVCLVVGLAYVMNLSGQTVTLGLWAAGAGPLFAAISPVVGWFGTALTGSDTSTNALFGLLQVTTARATGLSDVLLAAANSSGGVIGKAVSPQNLAIAAVAVGMSGREGDLFRRVVGWTALLLALLSLLVFLQSTPVLSWMLP